MAICNISTIFHLISVHQMYLKPFHLEDKCFSAINFEKIVDMGNNEQKN